MRPLFALLTVVAFGASATAQSVEPARNTFDVENDSISSPARQVDAFWFNDPKSDLLGGNDFSLTGEQATRPAVVSGDALDLKREFSNVGAETVKHADEEVRPPERLTSNFIRIAQAKQDAWAAQLRMQQDFAKRRMDSLAIPSPKIRSQAVSIINAQQESAENYASQYVAKLNNQLNTLGGKRYGAMPVGDQITVDDLVASGFPGSQACGMVK